MLKSVMAGEYTAPPAHGPMIAEICGHDARGQRVAQEDVRVAAEREHALLDARAARIVQPDDGRAHLHGQVHHLDDLRGVGLRERPAEHREVLREGVDRPAVDPAVAGHDAVARHDLVRHAEIAAPVRDQLVDFLERAGVEQQIDALARRQLAGVVMTAKTLLAAAKLGEAFEIGEAGGGIHGAWGRGLAAWGLRAGAWA